MPTVRQVPTLAQVDPAWAWTAYDPARKANGLLPWNLAAVAHLYRRAGFAADWSTLQRALADGPQATVDRLLSGGEQSDSFYVDLERLAEPLVAGGSLQNLPAWWLYAMLHSPHALREKATLFWHGHFATSADKVSSVRLMYGQNRLLRRHALGSFRSLVEEISKDPAMLLWLDSAANQKRTPNENYARELMELFALGIGNYTEADIKEAARAFTGWEVRDERFRFNPAQHDGGEKTLLGRRGRWDGDDVVRIVLEQPAAARFITRKAFRFFVSEAEEPPDELLEPLAGGFREHKYDFAWLVETMLRSNLFFSASVRHQKIKSPAELAVGLVRALEANVNTYTLSNDLRDMGQHLFYPPNVKGWDGGKAWITTTTMVARANLVPTLLASADGPFGAQHPLQPLVERHKLTTPEQALDHFLRVLLGGPVPSSTRAELLATLQRNGNGSLPTLDAQLETVHAITALPVFQLC